MGRDWQMNEVDLRRAQLLEWIADSGADYPNLAPFYGDDEALGGVAYEDTRVLEARGLVDDASGMGGLGAVAASLTGDGQSFVAELRARRGDRAARQAACRSALVSWLYDQDACGDASRSAGWQEFFSDLRSWFYADAFSVDDVDRAAAWLKRQGLIDGTMTGEFDGPVRAFLTDQGVRCAEDFDADPAALLAAAAGGGHNGGINVSGISGGNVQIGGHQAHQTMNVGADPAQLALTIRGVVELMQLAGMLDGGGDEGLVDAAVDDVESGRNAGHVRDFLRWAKGRVEDGSNSAVSAGIGAGLVTVASQAHQLGHLVGL